MTLRFVFKRLLAAAGVMFAVTTLSFFVMRVAPGGPLDRDRVLPPEVMRNIAAKYHLDQPLWQQYTHYMGNILLRFDLGPSFKYSDRSVNEFIAEAFPVTLRLAIGAMCVAVILGVGSGLVAGVRQNTRWDYAAMGLALVGLSVPDFVLGPLMQMIFGLELGVLPVAGWYGFSYTVMPSLVLGMSYTAAMSRLTRAGMLEIARQDFVRTARAKGLHERVVLCRHMLRGALLPVVSYLGPAAAFMVSGSVVVEKIFDIPGLGRQFVTSALNRDYTMALGLTIFFSAIIIIFNFLVDIAHAWMDPRVKHE